MSWAHTMQIVIGRPWDEVCATLADPARYADWAAWLGPTLRCRRGEWSVQRGPLRAKVRFTPRNGYGVADHCVLEGPDRARFIALRAMPHEEACVVVATFFRPAECSEAQWAMQLDAAQQSLRRLQVLLEARRPQPAEPAWA